MQSKALKALIASFQTYLESSNYSENTILSYMKDLELFHCYCKEIFETEEVDISQIDTDVIRRYLIHLLDNKVTNRSIARKITTFKMFYKYLMIDEIVYVNPMKKIKTPKYATKLPMFFSETEIDTLCELPDTQTFLGMRDRAILELFYSSGLRISELVNLTLSAIDFSQQTVTVVGKGNKKRTVPLTKTAVEWMLTYNKIRNNEKTDRFFLSKYNEHLNRGNVYCIIKRYVNKLCLRNGYSPHTIRHTFATHLLKKGADLFAIKEMLGHANLSTTSIYTHITPENIRKEYIQGHPRADKKLNL